MNSKVQCHMQGRIQANVTDGRASVKESASAIFLAGNQ